MAQRLRWDKAKSTYGANGKYRPQPTEKVFLNLGNTRKFQNPIVGGEIDKQVLSTKRIITRLSRSDWMEICRKELNISQVGERIEIAGICFTYTASMDTVEDVLEYLKRDKGIEISFAEELQSEIVRESGKEESE